MTKFVLSALSLLLLPIFVLADDKDISSYLQDISVTIKAGNAEGSGVLTNVKGINYVWTAGHVVQHLKQNRTIVDPKTGSVKTLTEFDDAEIVKEYVEDGRMVGQIRFYAEVIRFSSHEGGEDLALLRLRKKNISPVKVKFYLDAKIPAIGTKLFHVGSLLGQGGSNSMTNGIYSQVGRLYQGTVYDQTTCPAFPGSSGGGVYLEDGRYMGMIVRGAGETFNLTVPIRRMKDWATKTGVAFTIDESLPVPSNEDLKKIPVEDIGFIGFPSTGKVKNEFGFRLKVLD